MTTESDEQFKARMDDLAIRIAKTVDGESALDVITAMAGLIAFGLVDQYDDVMTRAAALEKLIDFMRGLVIEKPMGRKCS